MTSRKNIFCLGALVALGFGMLGSPKSLVGQEYLDDFLFHQPKATISFNLGFNLPGAGSEVFDEAFDVYTLDKGDLTSFLIGGGVSVFVNDRLDVGFDFSYASSKNWVEYVEFVDNNDLPIEHEVRFTQVPLTLSAKYFLMSRGREVGNLSWIPTSWAPYIGVGGGRTYYEFEQAGDFIDYVDFSVFSSTFLSEGWAWVGHALAGVQWSISPQWVISAEGRYAFANAEMDRPAYRDYDKIDLSGFNGSIGFGIRF